MKLLPDTHLLVWAATEPRRLSKTASGMLQEPANEVFFSVVSIWEVAIKRSLNRPEFQVDPRRLRQGLLENGFLELPITGMHALESRDLPLIHNDPFDRMLIAQAISENITLLTADRLIAKYRGPIRKI